MGASTETPAVTLQTIRMIRPGMWGDVLYNGQSFLTWSGKRVESGREVLSKVDSDLLSWTCKVKNVLNEALPTIRQDTEHLEGHVRGSRETELRKHRISSMQLQSPSTCHWLAPPPSYAWTKSIEHKALAEYASTDWRVRVHYDIERPLTSA